MAKQPTWHIPVLTAVCQLFGVRNADVLTPNRHKRIALARHVCWYIHALDQHTLSKIGLAYGVDHSTVSHGKDRIARLRKTDSSLNMELTNLLTALSIGADAPQVYEINIPAGSIVTINNSGDLTGS